MGPTASPSKAHKGGKGKKPTGESHPPSDAGPSTATPPPSFLPHGPPSRKRQRSSTLPQFESDKWSVPIHYYAHLFNQAASGMGIENLPGESLHTIVLLDVIQMIHQDCRSAVDAIMESVDILTEEIVALKAETPRPKMPTPIPFKVANTKPLDVRPDPKPPLATRLAPPAQAPSWTTIVKKGRKTDNITRTTGPPTIAQPSLQKAANH